MRNLLKKIKNSLQLFLDLRSEPESVSTTMQTPQLSWMELQLQAPLTEAVNDGSDDWLAWPTNIGSQPDSNDFNIDPSFMHIADLRRSHPSTTSHNAWSGPVAPRSDFVNQVKIFVQSDFT